MQVLLKNERPRCLFCDAGGSSSKSIVEAVEAATKPAEDAAAEAIFEAIEEAAIVTAEAESIVAGAATVVDLTGIFTFFAILLLLVLFIQQSK